MNDTGAAAHTDHALLERAKAWDEGWAARAEYDTRRDVPLDWPDLNPYRAPAVSPEDDPAFCDRGPCHLPRGHEGRCNPGNSPRAA